jgi:adenylate cyclase
MGAVIFRHVWAKLAALALAAVALVGLSMALFLRADDIIFMPLASPLIATLLAGLGALAWSYFSEDRGRQTMERALAEYVSPQVAKQIARDPQHLNVGAARREMTVMFSDIAGFTNMSEKMDAEQLTRVLNFYLQELTEPVLGLNGFVDKFIGDAIMSFWNGPLLEQPDHADRACRAALLMRAREEAIQPELRKRGAGEMHTRFGINTGPMAVGNIGSIRKKGYTVIGDSVNLASRLEAANKLYGTQIIVTESTLNAAKGHFVTRPLDLLKVSGKTQPIAIFELMGEAPMDAEKADLAKRHGAAFAAYQKQDWDEAEATLWAIQRDFPDDGPAAALLNRIEHFRNSPPGANWDGSYEAKSK